MLKNFLQTVFLKLNQKEALFEYETEICEYYAMRYTGKPKDLAFKTQEWGKYFLLQEPVISGWGWMALFLTPILEWVCSSCSYFGKPYFDIFVLNPVMKTFSKILRVVLKPMLKVM